MTLKLSKIVYLVLPLVVLPGLAVLRHDNYILIGIACYYIGLLLSKLKLTIFFPIPLIFCGWFWYTYGFTFNHYVTIFFLCLLAGFVFNKLIVQFDRFIHRSMPEQELMADYDGKMEEMTRRLERYKADHPNQKITQHVIDDIRKDVFFG